MWLSTASALKRNTPEPTLPEITFRWADLTPPTKLPGPATVTPATLLPSALVPLTSVPMKLPSTWLPVAPDPPIATPAFGLKAPPDRKSTRLNSSHEWISYAVLRLKKKHNVTHP